MRAAAGDSLPTPQGSDSGGVERITYATGSLDAGLHAVLRASEASSVAQDTASVANFLSQSRRSEGTSSGHSRDVTYLPPFEARTALDRQRMSRKDYPSCEECVSAPRAQAHCRDCQMNLCGLCVAQHRRVKSSAHHAVSALPQPEGDEDPRAALFCSTHHNLKCELFCEDCDQPICYECATSAHQDHVYKLPSSGLVEKHRLAIRVAVEALCAKLLEMLSLRRSIQEVVETQSREAQKVRSGIDGAFDRFHEVVSCRVDAMSAHVTDTVGGVLTALETEKAECSSALAEIWSTLDFVEKVCSGGTDLEMLQAKSMLQQTLEKRVVQWQDLARRRIPDVEGDISAGWRSPAEAQQVLHLVRSFGTVEVSGARSACCPPQPDVADARTA